MGTFLVGFQMLFVAILLLGAGANIYEADALPPASAFVLLALSILVGLWTLTANRPGNFSIFPAPKSDAQLITSGPYRRIRHPMYSSVLLFGLACVFAWPSVWAILSWMALWITLDRKSRLEETFLEERYPQYASYRSTAGRFLPSLKAGSTIDR